MDFKITVFDFFLTAYVLLLLFRFEFDSYDFHSGLKEIHWLLHDSLDSNLEHGSGHVAVHKHTVGVKLARSCPSFKMTI